jgi:hypothetical protein
MAKSLPEYLMRILAHLSLILTSLLNFGSSIGSICANQEPSLY